MITHEAVPLPEIDGESIRRGIAGLRDPDSHDESRAAEYRRNAVALGVVLCRLYDLGDRVKLWDRIASALTAMCDKVQDGDIDRALSLCASHVMSESAKAAHNDAFAKLVFEWGRRDLAWRQGLMRWMRGRIPSVITHVKYAWQGEKVRLKDEAALRRGGELSTGEIIEKE